MLKKNFDKKKLGPGIFWVQKILGSNILGQKKRLSLEKDVGQKNLWFGKKLLVKSYCPQGKCCMDIYMSLGNLYQEVTLGSGCQISYLWYLSFCGKLGEGSCCCCCYFENQSQLLVLGSILTILTIMLTPQASIQDYTESCKTEQSLSELSVCESVNL